jgi:hypothetical protein
MRAAALIPFLTVLAAAAPAAAAVDLTGQSLSAAFYGLTSALPWTVPTPFANPAIVGPGVEFAAVADPVPGLDIFFTIDVSSTGFDLTLGYPPGVLYSPTDELFGIQLSGFSGIGAIFLDGYSCTGDACDAPGLGAGSRVISAMSDASTAQVTFSAVRNGETYSFKFADPVAETPVSTVPEPSSWALMLAGFALAGAASRRRRAIVG